MVIFVTVGSQMPFDRLVIGMDAWAAKHRDHVVTAQIGESSYAPKAMAAVNSLPPAQFVQRVREADLVVAHAGMGSVISAAEYGKPMVLLPRRGDLRETRNDHQMATVKWLALKEGIFVAQDESKLDETVGVALLHAEQSSAANADPLLMVGNLKVLLRNLCA
jgi:UDP-N-acetylglucosamine transferase subunit ALG13